ncbi:hypothetical protein [Frigoribacterium sp. PhB24]|uniref:hypothetical protein n=1 Tax=Frigoribacterium sp. PhB24 TaxID=2485204 RepID=UPI000F96A050|nr:hypothetical protein [Frigoribacterium sp. PhB24]ROS48021.1 hypothetical protein EDF50_3153 [Frigoribacterium sp. PhB24]
MESHYTSDPETRRVDIHPYPKQQSPTGGPRDGRARDQEARLATVASRPVRYEDFFEDDEGASRSA